MPLSEFYQASIRGKHDSTQSKMANCSSNLSSFMSDNEFVELIWENGQIVMQSKSNRPRKTSIATTNLSSPDERVERKDSTAISMTKMGRLETMNSFASDFSPSDPSSNVRMSAQFDSMVPWINYPIEEPAPNDYCSDFFSEFPGVIMPSNGNNSAGHNIKDSPNVANGLVSKALTDESDLSTLRTMHQSSQSYQSSFPSNTSRTEDLGTRAGNNAQQGTSGDLLGTRLQKQDIATSRPHQMGISMDSINFSHFSRLGVLAKANLQSVDIDRLRSNQNSPTAASSNRIESTAIQSSCGLQSTSGIQGQLSSVSAMSELGSSMKTSREFVSVEQLEAVYDEDVPRKNHNDDITKINLRSPDQMNHQSSDLAAGISLGRSGIEKDREAIVSSSSVCSGNTAGAISDDPKQSAKRKNQEEEESDNHIEDLEDASVGIKKPAAVKGMSAKRSRAAEVHNLSERRRRDRINEKMRALQELIPNCSKVDKASMLDEAIEYLKTLQLQVQFLTQMMSMGTGLRIPPMMLPNGMQHMRVPPVPQFSQIGVGMGMNMRFGYGMGMLDMNGSPGCPLIPAPPMHGTPFPCSAVPGLHSLYAMPRSTNLPTFGLPAPGLPMSVPRVPPFTFMSGLSANLNSMPGASTTATTTLQAPDAAPSTSSKDQQENSLNLELLQKTNANDSQGIKESSQQCMSNQTSSASENETVN